MWQDFDPLQVLLHKFNSTAWIYHENSFHCTQSCLICEQQSKANSSHLFLYDMDSEKWVQPLFSFFLTYHCLVLGMEAIDLFWQEGKPLQTAYVNGLSEC